VQINRENDSTKTLGEGVGRSAKVCGGVKKWAFSLRGGGGTRKERLRQRAKEKGERDGREVCAGARVMGGMLRRRAGEKVEKTTLLTRMGILRLKTGEGEKKRRTRRVTGARRARAVLS